MTMKKKRSPRHLLPYATILAATYGDAVAMEAVLRHYDRYINKLATRILYDKGGNVYTVVDETLKARLELKLMMGVLSFKVA